MDQKAPEYLTIDGTMLALQQTEIVYLSAYCTILSIYLQQAKGWQGIRKLQGMHDFYPLTSVCRSIVAGEVVVVKIHLPLIALGAKHRESPSFVRSAKHRLRIPL